MRYRYVGPGPQPDGDGGVVRPGEERDFDSEPLWGPWELLLEEYPGTGQPGVGIEHPADGTWSPLIGNDTESAPAPTAATPAPATDTGKGVS